MSNGNIYIYILIMAVATYIIRALPMTLIRGEIKNPFIKSFLHYVPYATLSALIFPDSIFCTCSRDLVTNELIITTPAIVSAIVGIIVALYLSYKEKDLIVVSFLACLAVFVTDKLFALE